MLTTLAILALGLCLIPAGVIVAIQRSMVFPRHLLPPLTRHTGLADDVEDVIVETADGERLYGLWKKPAPRCPVVVSFHGNAATPGEAAERFSSGRWADNGWGVLAIAYRGYPGSTGSPSETGLLADGDAAFAFVERTAPGSPVLVHGYSIGTGVAVAMAASHKVIGVYLEAPYASLVGMAKLHFPYLPGFLMRDPMRSDLRIGKVEAPILAIHGRQDTIIPLASAQALFDKAPSTSRLIEVNGDHISIFGQIDEVAEPTFRQACAGKALQGAAQ